MFRKIRRVVLTRLFSILYDTGRWAYDPLTRVFFGSAWHNWRRTVLPFTGPDRTLELACGTGQLIPEIAERSSFTVGLDYSDSMLEPALKRIRESNLNASIVRSDARALPFEDASFDAVVSTFPASFIANERTLNEIARVLRPGGKFAVVVSARFTRFQWKRPFVHPVLRIAYGSTRSMNRWSDDLLAHPLMPGEWQDLRTPEGEAFVWIARKRARGEA
jgi:ubiquinone/menaquinone biosynthesis C-methylase UbiE